MPSFTSSAALGADVINVSARVPLTHAEGPGARFALWVQGCPLRCPGCCNPHMLEDRVASLEPTEAIIREVLAAPDIEGVTLIGGEPFWQAAALSRVARAARERGLSVMVFTGMRLEQIERQGRADWDAFLGEIDLLVDGPYVRSKHVSDRRWIGSANQRDHFLSPRYAHLRERWDEGPNTIELRLVGGEVSINGFPEESIVELSRASIRRKQ